MVGSFAIPLLSGELIVRQSGNLLKSFLICSITVTVLCLLMALHVLDLDLALAFASRGDFSALWKINGAEALQYEFKAPCT